MRKQIRFLYFKMIFWVVGFVGAVMMTYGPLYLDANGAGNLIWLYFTLSAFAAFAGQNIWGPLFDRFPRPGLFIRGSLAVDLVLVGLFIVLKTPVILIVSFAMLLLLGDAYYPAIQATVTFWYPDQKGRKLGELFAFKSIGWCTASIAGVILFLTKDISSIVFLFKLGFIFLLILFVFSFMPFEQVRKTSARVLRPLSGQIRLLSENRELRWFSFLLLWVCSANALFFSQFSVFFKNAVGGTESGLGISMMLATILGAVSYPIYGRLGDRKSGYFLMNFGMIAYLLNFVLMIFLKNPFAIIVIYAFPVYSSLRMAGSIFISNHTDDEERGTGLGLIESMHALGMVVGPLISGFFVREEMFGLPHLPHVATGFILFYALFYFLRNLRLPEAVKS